MGVKDKTQLVTTEQSRVALKFGFSRQSISMKQVVRVLLYDVVLAAVHIGVDAYLIYSYLRDGDEWWAAATISAVCLPGLLELFTYTYSLLHGDLSGLQEYLIWALGFGPITYPFSLVGWHIYQVYKGEEHFLRYENIARSRVLTSLSVLTKSAIQLGLQTTIIMIRWDKSTLSNHVYQMISVSISLISLAKSCADHHYFEGSGKNVQAHTPYGQKIKRLLFNTQQILIRGFVIALLAGYLQFFTLVFLFSMVILNYIIANIFIQSEGSKHFWTAFSAVLLPTCFASRDALKDKDPSFGRKMFARFYRCNSLVFFLVFGIAGLLTTNFIIRFTDMSYFTCINLPFLSFDKNCSKSSPFSSPIFNLPPPHAWFYFLGNLLVILLSLVHVFLIFIEEICIRDSRIISV